jgi:hypothetical protein
MARGIDDRRRREELARVNATLDQLQEDDRRLRRDIEVLAELERRDREARRRRIRRRREDAEREAASTVGRAQRKTEQPRPSFDDHPPCVPSFRSPPGPPSSRPSRT